MVDRVIITIPAKRKKRPTVDAGAQAGPVRTPVPPEASALDRTPMRQLSGSPTPTEPTSPPARRNIAPMPAFAGRGVRQSSASGLIEIFGRLASARELIPLAPRLFEQGLTVALLVDTAKASEELRERFLADFIRDFDGVLAVPGHKLRLRLVLNMLRAEHES